VGFLALGDLCRLVGYPYNVHGFLLVRVWFTRFKRTIQRGLGLWQLDLHNARDCIKHEDPHFVVLDKRIATILCNWQRCLLLPGVRPVVIEFGVIRNVWHVPHDVRTSVELFCRCTLQFYVRSCRHWHVVLAQVYQQLVNERRRQGRVGIKRKRSQI